MATNQNVEQYWDSGFCRRNGDYGADVFAQYPYEVSFRLNDYSNISILKEMEKFCKEEFGRLDETDPKCPWQVCREYEYIDRGDGATEMIPKVVFLFHSETNAVAFKLACL